MAYIAFVSVYFFSFITARMKVMFSEASVSHSVQGEGSWLPNMHDRSHDQGSLPPGGGDLPPGGSASRGLGRSPHLTLTLRTIGYSQQPGGTHPTGMHSCWCYSFKVVTYCFKCGHFIP